MENKYNEIYNNLENKSVGVDKKCINNRKKRSVVLKISLISLIGVLVSVGSFGLIKSKKDYELWDNINNESEYNFDYENYGYSDIEIYSYGRIRAKTLLNYYGFIDFEKVRDGKDYRYNYTAEDYKKIVSLLDESYLYFLYSIFDSYSFDEILKSIGYENLDAYLISNNYVNSKGEADIIEWNLVAYGETARIMNEETKGDVRTK